jgi:hypothetical protein
MITMGDAMPPNLFQGFGDRIQSVGDNVRRYGPTIGIVIGSVAIMAFPILSPNSPILRNLPVPQIVSLFIAAILAAAPLLACFVQTLSIERQS